MKTKCQIYHLGVLIAICICSCEQSKKPKTDTDSSTQTGTYTGNFSGQGTFTDGLSSGAAGGFGSQGGLGQQSFGNSGSIDIREINSNFGGNVLLINPGQSVTWRFQAIDTLGSARAPQITGVQPNRTDLLAQGIMTIQPPSGVGPIVSVTFSPRSGSERLIAGLTITVHAGNSGTNYTGGGSGTFGQSPSITAGSTYTGGYTYGDGYNTEGNTYTGSTSYTGGNTYGGNGYTTVGYTNDLSANGRSSASSPANFSSGTTKVFTVQTGNGFGSFGYGNSGNSGSLLPRVLLSVVPALFTGNFGLGTILRAIVGGGYGYAPHNYTGGFQSGYQGGYGGYQTGGYQSGYQGGYGGYQTGGYQSGYQGGYGGYQTGGYQSGYQAGGYQSGYQAGGYQSGYQSGYQAGGYQSGYQSGYQAGGYQSGYQAGGYQSGYQAGGYQGGYQNGFGLGPKEGDR